MKKILAIAGACLVAMTCWSSAASAADGTISAGLSATTARVGTTVYVQGKVNPASLTPRVHVQRYLGGTWSDRASGDVNPSTGAYKIAIKPSQSGTYKLRVRSNGGSIVSTTVQLSVTPPPSISARSSARTITLGATVTLSGKVTPASATPRVVVQRVIDHRWVDRDSAAVNTSTGAYSVSIKPSQTGTYKLRVRSAGGSVLSSIVYVTIKPKPASTGGGGGGGGGCNPNYTPCVPNASDVDCAGGSGNGPAYVQGPVRVVGTDVYGLDSDHDGIGCE